MTVNVNGNGIALMRHRLARSFRPREKMWVWEYADRHQLLNRTASREHGAYRTSRFPFLREPMECMSPQHPCKKIVIMKGAQLGFSDALKNLILYIIAEDPGPVLIALPTISLAKRWAQQRLRPMLRNTPVLKQIFAQSTQKDVDGLINIDFPNGNIQVVGSNSAADLSQMSARYAFVDELDRCSKNVGGEGDFVKIIENRAMSFDNRKVVFLGTPVDEYGYTNREFLLSDQRYYYVPCPACDKKQIMTWNHINWVDEDPNTAAFACEYCGVVSDDSHKTYMLENGEWIPHNPDSEVVGFHLSSLYCPIGFYSWNSAVKDWLESLNNELMIQAFENTKLGIPTKSSGDAPPWKDLFTRRESYQIGVVPDKVFVLTAGVDVQADRVEIEVIGWAPGFESWSIDYQVFYGNPYTPEPWNQLARYISLAFPVEGGGSLSIAKVAVDTGFATQEVYKFIRQYNEIQVIGVKGQHSCLTPIGRVSHVDVDYDGRKVTNGALVWSVGSSVIKAQIYGWLKLAINDDLSFPPGYCHFPEYPQEYFQQLTAEQQVSSTNRDGFPVGKWVKIRERNEALDVRVYARAALTSLGADRWTENEWGLARGFLDNPITSTQEAAPTSSTQQRSRSSRRQEDRSKKQSWLSR